MKIGEKRTRNRFVKGEKKPNRQQVEMIHSPFYTHTQKRQRHRSILTLP